MHAFRRCRSYCPRIRRSAILASLALTAAFVLGAASTGLAQEQRKTSEEAVEKSAAVEKSQVAKGDKKPGGKKVSDKKPEERPPRPKPKPKPISAVVGATIHTMTAHGVIENGIVLIQDGKILKVGGADLKIPEGATKVDVTGLQLSPGWIDSDSKLWLTSASASTTASDGSLKLLDGVDAFSDDWNEAVAHGVTSVYVQPSSRGTLGGSGIVLSTVPKDDSSVEVLAESTAMQASIGLGASNNQVRSQQYARTKKAFDDAKAYKKKWDEYKAYIKKKEEEEKKAKAAGKKPSATKKPTTGSSSKPVDPRAAMIARMRAQQAAAKSGSTSSSSSSDAAKAAAAKAAAAKAAAAKKPPAKPDVDPAKEKLLLVLDGKLPLRLEVHKADDAYYAMKLLKDFDKLQIVLTGLTNLGSAEADVLKAGSPVVLGPWLKSAPGYATNPDSARVWSRFLKDYQGSLLIASRATSGRGSRMLRSHVASAIAHGVSPERALAAVTSNAARVLGLSDKLGTIAEGKRADLVAFGGSPTDSSSPVSRVWVAGKQVVLRDVDAQAGRDLASDVSGTESLPLNYQLFSTRCLVSSGDMISAVVRVKDGKIASIKKAKKAPKGAIDLGSAVITPGLFSAAASLGLSSQVDPSSQPDSSYVVAADAMTTGISQEQALLESGLLHVALVPGDSNPMAGSASMIRVGANEPVAQEVAAAKLVLSGAARSTSRFPSSLAGQLQFIDRSFAGELLDTRLYLPDAVVARLEKRRLAGLKAIKSGKTPALIVANDPAEIRGALELVHALGLKASLMGGRELKNFLPELKKLGMRVIASPVGPSNYDWYLDELVEADSRGIPVAFSGENAEQLRLLASQAVARGMNARRALAALCHGVDGYVHTSGIAAGNAADLVVWSTSPLDLSAKPLAVIVDGKLVASEGQQ